MLVEPDISPLAKRLAEENNVNWRGLLGSGAGGKIVERDVLEYLAKVMAGEEDINPTAEPLPEGMDAWPEDDVRSFYGGAMPAEGSQAATAPVAEEELFIDTPDLGGFETPVASSSALHQATEDTLGLGEDIFLIDEEVPVQNASLDVADIAEQPAFASEIESFSSDAVDMVDDSLGIDDIATFDDDTEVFTAMSESIEDAFASDSDVEDLASLFVEETESVEDSYAADAAVVDQTVTFEAPAEPDFGIPAYDSFAHNSDMVAEDVVEALAVEGVDDVVASFEDETAFDAVSGLEDTFAAEELVAATFVVEEPVVQTPIVQPPVVQTPVTPVVEDLSVPPTPAFTEVAPVVAAVAGASMAASVVEQAPAVQGHLPQSNLPLVSYGVLLRRHVDLTTLMHAQQAIAEEMGQEESGSVAGLLLRAAAKAQQKVSLVPGKSVGLAVIREGGVSVAHVHDAASAPFRTVMSQTQHALSSHQTDRLDLAVADMSNFDIDEAVLNIGVPVLTLGRTLYDSSKGTHHSTLSLSGNVSIESGTKFLSAVAELLNSPVRLVI
jgi:hypothetical protein